MLKNYVTLLQTYLNSHDTNLNAPPKNMVQYLNDHLGVVATQTELSHRPMVHCLKSQMHIALLDAHFDGETDDTMQSQVEALWRNAIAFADSQRQIAAVA
ncbi:hypothetical protein AHAT_37770 [Agarivorans sp. Toyoura001]|nr:hypothetical protein AHAT_37770 [Agarivorans sp. Toyoura001]